MSTDMPTSNPEPVDTARDSFVNDVVVAANLTDTMLVTKIDQLNDFRRGARESFRVGSLETFVQANQSGVVLVRPGEPNLSVDILDVAEALDRRVADRRATGDFVVYETPSPYQLLADGAIGVEVHDQLADGTFVDGFRRVEPNTDEHTAILGSGVSIRRPE